MNKELYKYYRQHLLKTKRQKALNDFIDRIHSNSRLVSSEAFEFFKQNPHDAEIKDGKKIEIMPISKSDKISIEDLNNLKELKNRGEVLFLVKSGIYKKKGFTESYIK